MKNNELLLEKNFDKNFICKIRLVNKCDIRYNSNIKIFNFLELRRVIDFVNLAFRKFPLCRISFYFNYEESFRFKDKLTYILFETICDYIIEIKKCNVVFKFIANHTIFSEGVKNSCLIKLADTRKETNLCFLKNYNKVLSSSCYRKIISYDEYNDKPELVSILMGDIKIFLQRYNINIEKCKQLAKVVSELVDNAFEHSQSDCLIDLDVTESYDKGEQLNAFRGVNLVVMNFAHILLGTQIKYVMENNLIENEFYSRLKKIKEGHYPYWNEIYKEEDFYMISSFQHHISSRQSSKNTGGKGLTQLLTALEENSDNYDCYVISGNRKLYFKHDYLKFDNQHWVGFNKTNNCEIIPDFECLKESNINICGTAFNLNFVFKKEDIDNGQ